MVYVDNFDQFQFSFVLCDKYGSRLIILHAFALFNQHHLLKVLFFFQCEFLASVSKIKYPYMCGFVSVS